MVEQELPEPAEPTKILTALEFHQYGKTLADRLPYSYQVARTCQEVLQRFGQDPDKFKLLTDTDRATIQLQYNPQGTNGQIMIDIKQFRRGSDAVEVRFYPAHSLWDSNRIDLESANRDIRSVLEEDNQPFQE